MRVVVQQKGRRAKVSGTHLELRADGRTQRVMARSRKDAIGLVIDFVERGTDLATLSNDPRVQVR